MLDTDMKNGSQEINIETIKSTFSLRDKQLRSFNSKRARKHYIRMIIGMKKSKCERVVQVTDFRWSFLKKIATKKNGINFRPGSEGR